MAREYSGHLRVKAPLIPTKLQRELLDLINDKEVMREAHRMLGEMCNEYVPMKSGELRRSMKAYPKTVRWETPYAHYQYMGEVYGPNVPIVTGGTLTGFYKVSGRTYPRFSGGTITGWFSYPGLKKRPTGRELGVPGYWKGWKFGYTKAGTTHHWFDEAMKNGGKRNYSRAVTEMLKKEAKKRGLK